MTRRTFNAGGTLTLKSFSYFGWETSKRHSGRKWHKSMHTTAKREPYGTACRQRNESGEWPSSKHKK